MLCDRSRRLVGVNQSGEFIDARLNELSRDVRENFPMKFFAGPRPSAGVNQSHWRRKFAAALDDFGDNVLRDIEVEFDQNARVETNRFLR
jgi:hypothetical protein